MLCWPAHSCTPKHNYGSCSSQHHSTCSNKISDNCTESTATNTQVARHIDSREEHWRGDQTPDERPSWTCCSYRTRCRTRATSRCTRLCLGTLVGVTCKHLLLSSRCTWGAPRGGRNSACLSPRSSHGQILTTLNAYILAHNRAGPVVLYGTIKVDRRSSVWCKCCFLACDWCPRQALMRCYALASTERWAGRPNCLLETMDYDGTQENNGFPPLIFSQCKHRQLLWKPPRCGIDSCILPGHFEPLTTCIDLLELVFHSDHRKLLHKGFGLQNKVLQI